MRIARAVHNSGRYQSLPRSQLAPPPRDARRMHLGFNGGLLIFVSNTDVVASAYVDHSARPPTKPWGRESLSLWSTQPHDYGHGRSNKELRPSRCPPRRAKTNHLPLAYRVAVSKAYR
jgi:hypothetical protein